MMHHLVTKWQAITLSSVCVTSWNGCWRWRNLRCRRLCMFATSSKFFSAVGTGNRFHPVRKLQQQNTDRGWRLTTISQCRKAHNVTNTKGFLKLTSSVDPYFVVLNDFYIQCVSVKVSAAATSGSRLGSRTSRLEQNAQRLGLVSVSAWKVSCTSLLCCVVLYKTCANYLRERGYEDTDVKFCEPIALMRCSWFGLKTTGRSIRDF